MKFPLSIICLFTALTATAFSSAKWLEERGDDSDVMRLRAAYAECVKKLEAPAENVQIPLETFPNGQVKSRVTARRAHVFQDTGFVWGEKVREHSSPSSRSARKEASVWATSATLN